MTLRTTIVAILTALGLSAAAAGYDVNKDLTNEGPPAHDLAVVLSGGETVTDHFDGYTSGPYRGQFGSFASGPQGQNTLLRWTNFNDGGNNIIDTGQTIHVGWSTQDHSSNILDMYWTDASGNRIPGSVVHNITSGWRYESRRADVQWEYEFNHGAPITIYQVYFAVLPLPVPLANLNRENRELDMALRPLPGGEQFVLTPGQERTLPIPVPVEPGQAVVLRYRCMAPSSHAVAMDYVQFLAEAEARTCHYTIKKSKAKGGCEACPHRGDDIETEQPCHDVADCRKKLKTTIPCPDGGPGSCTIKAKRRACE